MVCNKSDFKSSTRNLLFRFVSFCAILLAIGYSAANANGPNHDSAITIPPSRPPTPNPLFVEFHHSPNANTLSKLKAHPLIKKIKLFNPYPSDYFSRLYEIETQNETQTREYLEKLSAVKKIESDYAVEAYSIIPSDNKNPKTNDPFFNYQWALHNNGQVLLKDIDDIHLERLSGDPRADTGWHRVLKNIHQKIKKDILVAVIDSGVDVDHEDLKNNIYKNEAECDKGRITTKPVEDKDGNGYIGDCMGWNFTSLDPRLDNRPYDDVGHGTHIAGILAAEVGNQIGISGLSNHIKILPIKVLMDPDKERQISNTLPRKETNADQNQDRDESKRRHPQSLTSRIAKGLLYAIHSKADVINLSLGWPNRIDTTYLREAFAEAHKKNIVIVAAVGNNDNARQIFPCSYQNVICVGSVNNQGRFSEFSNFGGHVDVLAPGDNILSLHPTTDPDDSFSTNGYAIKSGTSQAAPFVTGYVALMKGLWPGISLDEVTARLYLGSTNLDPISEKYSLHGLTQLDRALEAKTQPVVRPVFKEMDRVSYDKKSKRFKFSLPIKNYWLATRDVRVKIDSAHPAIRLNLSSAPLGSLGLGETKFVTVNGEILNEKAHSDLDFAVSIYANGVSQGQFRHQIIISLNLTTSSDFIKYTINKEDPDLELATVPTPQHLYPYPEYYTLRQNKESFEFKIYKFENDKLSPSCQFYIPNAVRLISFVKMDVNQDHQPDYFIRTLAQKDNQVFVQYSYANANCEPLFGTHSHFKLQYNGEFSSFKDEFLSAEFKFTHLQSDFGLLSLPIFFGRGVSPKLDQNKDPLEFEPNPVQAHLYYFTPRIQDGEALLDIRTLNNRQFEEEVRKKLGLKFKDQIDFLEVLTQNNEDFEAGVIRVLVAIGHGYAREHYILVTDSERLLKKEYALVPAQYQGLNFAGHLLNSVIGLDGSTAEFSSASSLVGFLSETVAQLTFLDSKNPAGIRHQTRIEQTDKKDHLLDYIQSYSKGEKNYGFFLSKSRLILKIADPRQDKTLDAPIVRFSFLPGQLFKESLYPIVRKSKEGLSPALYVNASQISSRHFYVWTVVDDKLIAPMDLNVEIPDGCRALNPVRFGEDGHFSYVLLCNDGTLGTYSLF